MEKYIANEKMIKAIVLQKNADKKIAMAMSSIKRADFLNDSVKSLAYTNMPLPIICKETTTSPSIIAYMLKNLDIRKGMSVLEIGTGSGYQTALIAKIVGKKGIVISMEKNKDIRIIAEDNIHRYNLRNIKIIEMDGKQGFANSAPYDRIIISTPFKSIPGCLKNQLGKDGKIIYLTSKKNALFYFICIAMKKRDKLIKMILRPASFVEF